MGSSADAEDRYDFNPVATDPASGKVTNASGARAGTLHACFGPASDSLVASFYAEGDVGGVSLVGHGQCRMTKGDFPEAANLVVDLPTRPDGTTFWIRWGPAYDKHARIAHAPWTRPPIQGYAQASIATVRLWNTR